MKKGKLIVISGPSGTGKGTICKEILKRCHNIYMSISATTREPRDGEVDGKDYYFLSKEEMIKKIDNKELLEWAEVYGNIYGTPKDKVEEMLEAGKDVLLEIDTQGALNVQKMFLTEGTFIFLLPPSLSELEKRIRNRGKDSKDAIVKRLNAAILEIPLGHHYDYVVINDIIEDTVNNILSIINAEKFAVYNNGDTIDAFIKKV